MSDDAKERKVRRDKGLIMATERDLFCLLWIAEQYAARFDQIQRLLSRFPDPHKPFRGELIAETTVKDLIARWQRAGWIDYQRFLADGRGYAWVTKKGLALVELDDVFTARPPASTRLLHIYAVNQVRLWMDLQGFEWISERRSKASFEKVKKGETLGPIPDALVRSKDHGKVAIEVEISPKKPADTAEKLRNLLYATELNMERLHDEQMFPLVWFYVPNQRMKKLVEAACEKLEAEYQLRVRVAVQADLIA